MEAVEEGAAAEKLFRRCSASIINSSCVSLTCLCVSMHAQTKRVSRMTL